ncbi:hypothetical protein CGZ93_15280 [Enemella dayhoffiae]|uniref:Cardiolipin synthase N-terminal domain-containing protein n=1 Tax=Enemella dayhoffiae TaxID=2016507 RepID=A0A255GSE5_9ACTN|nr:PLD nuclease N-terminal domain-containing protein [Enemella dayhoffiae]OYO18352.1 hypothetical protein CGZ93_15280 [Enemella dayhoffiae]
MLRFLPLIIVVMLMIYCIVDVAQARPDETRLAPRWLWVAGVIALPLVGAVSWLIWGRPNAQSIAEADAERRPAAPDDDPDFLRRLR